MSTYGSFNSKSPTMRRICKNSLPPLENRSKYRAVKEASELATNPSTDYHASPLEDNLFEWHFTLRGPPDPSPYANGLYHGRIVLPTTYPLRPPSFRFLTPSGRFEANREICLSISGHHEETWQPAWGIRTALVAIRSFMDTDAKGQLGGLQCDDDARKKMASRSGDYTCPTCQKSNRIIMEERGEEVKKFGDMGKETKEEQVPEELRLAYREDLDLEKKPAATTAKDDQTENMPIASPPPLNLSPIPVASQTAQQPRRRAGAQESTESWVDMAIYGIAAVLAILVARKALSYLGS
jgi:ubiquitin-conjugating enzyme E2 J1